VPTAAQLITNIRSLALVGTTGAADLTRVEGYFNMAYREIYEKVAEKYPWFVQGTQEVVMTAGSGTFATQPLTILSVRDVNRSLVELTPTDVLAVEKCDPGIDDTGNPDKYYVNGFSNLKSHPLSNTTLRVRYTPNPVVLDNDSGEADIMLQPVHHDVLTWGTLKLMAYDERDKVVGAELAYNKEAHEAVEDRMWRWFESHAPKSRKPVKSYLG
jgi:hypothetical protein